MSAVPFKWDSRWTWFHTFESPPRNTEQGGVVVYKFQLDKSEEQLEGGLEFEELDEDRGNTGGGNYYSSCTLRQSEDFMKSFRSQFSGSSSKPWLSSMFILDFAGCQTPSELCINFICSFDAALKKAHEANSRWRKQQRQGMGIARAPTESWQHDESPDKYTLTELFGDKFVPGFCSGGTEDRFVLVSLPYLGLRRGDRIQPGKDSCDLHEYMTGTRLGNYSLKSEDRNTVYQARVLVIGKEVISVFRSEDDDYIYPGVTQSGFNMDVGHSAGECLLPIISNIINHCEPTIVENLTRAVSKEHVTILGILMDTGDGTFEGTTMDEMLRKRNQTLAGVSFEISAIIRVMDSQNSVLEKIAKQSGPDILPPDLAPNALDELRQGMLPARKKLREEMVNLISTTKYLQKQVSQIMADRIAQRQTWAAMKQAEETQIQVELSRQAQELSRIQVDLSKRAQDISKQTQKQGNSVLVFTIITTVFLPLSFFTSYFGMNTTDMRMTEWTQSKFWAVCGPVSTITIGVALLAAFRGNTMKFLGLSTKHELMDEESRGVKQD